MRNGHPYRQISPPKRGVEIRKHLVRAHSMRPQAADRRPYGVFLITALLIGGLFIRFALGSRKTPSDCRNEDGVSHARKPRTPCRLRDKPRQAAARRRPHGYGAPDSLRHPAPSDRRQKFGKRLFFNTAGSRDGNPHAPKRHGKSKSACPATLCGLPFRFYRALCRNKATHCADYPAYACFLRFRQFGRLQTYAAPRRCI